MNDLRTGWVPVCGVIFIALLTFLMVRMSELSDAHRLPFISGFATPNWCDNSPDLQAAKLVSSTAANQKRSHNASEAKPTHSFSQLSSLAHVSQPLEYSDDVKSQTQKLSELEASRYVLRNIASSGPSTPIAPKSPFHTAESHKLVVPEAIQAENTELDNSEEDVATVPFEDEEIEFISTGNAVSELDPQQVGTRLTDDGATDSQVELQMSQEAAANQSATPGNQSSHATPKQRSSILQATPSRVPSKTSPAWAKPVALIRDLEELYESPLTASWAQSTAQVLQGLSFLRGLDDPDTQIVFNQLESQLEKLEFLIKQVSTTPTESVQQATGGLAIRLRDVGYAIERRLEVWPLVHHLSKTEQLKAPAQTVDGYHVSQFLLASRSRLNTSEVEKGWAEYLQLEQAAQVFNSLNPKPYDKKKAARAVLARLYSPALSVAQTKYLRNAIDPQTIGILKLTAADNVDLRRLLKRLEKLEANDNGATQFYVNDSYQNLLWSNVAEYQMLAEQLQTHYRNANFRVSISERMLNQMLPRIPTTREPYRDRVMGANVVGQNQIYNQMRVSLIPDPDQIAMRLESHGKVNSRTTATRDGITVENAGTSRFKIIKRLAFGQNGIFAYRPETTSHIAQRVVDLRSNVDNIPGIGRLVRNIARSKIEEQAPATKRYAQSQLEKKAEQRFDKEIEQRLNQLEETLTNNLLHPLIAMDLEPDPVQISTTADRITMRYRLAGRDQMGASTARPRGVGNSLMNLQVHESAINNMATRLDLAGRKFTTQQLVEYVNNTFGLQMISLDDAVKKKPAEFHFAPFDPFRVQFVDAKIVISFNLTSFRIGEGKRWKNLTVKTTYDPFIANGSRLTLQQAEEGVRVSGKRINAGDSIAVGLICKVLFPEHFEIKLMPERLEQQLNFAALQATQFIIANGWLGLTLDDKLQNRQQQRRAQQHRPHGPNAKTARRYHPTQRPPQPSQQYRQQQQHRQR